MFMKEKMSQWMARAAGCLALGLIVGCVGAPDDVTDGENTAEAAETLITASNYSGRAVAINGTIQTLPFTVVDTGSLLPAGGSLSANAPTTNLLGVLTATTLGANTMGIAQGTTTDTMLQNLVINYGFLPGIIKADIAGSTASATCTQAGTAPTLLGVTAITNLSILGAPVTVTGAINQTIPLVIGSFNLGQVVINEQTTATTPNSGAIQVAALHVTLNGFLDLTLLASHADVTCDPEQPPCRDTDWVFSNHGFILLNAAGNPGNFAFGAGTANGLLTGFFDYNDPALPEHVVATSVLTYITTGPNSRQFTGLATVNGVPGFTYTAGVLDNGANDTFALVVSDGYVATGPVHSGDIQLETNTCP
jgi:hypothetical protein